MRFKARNDFSGSVNLATNKKITTACYALLVLASPMLTMFPEQINKEAISFSYLNNIQLHIKLSRTYISIELDTRYKLTNANLKNNYLHCSSDLHYRVLVVLNGKDRNIIYYYIHIYIYYCNNIYIIMYIHDYIYIKESIHL